MKNSKEKIRKRNDKFEAEKECLLFADIRKVMKRNKGKGHGHQVEGDGAHMGPLAKLSSLRLSMVYHREFSFLNN